jgi:hypothetical protein
MVKEIAVLPCMDTSELAYLFDSYDQVLQERVWTKSAALINLAASIPLDVAMRPA